MARYRSIRSTGSYHRPTTGDRRPLIPATPAASPKAARAVAVLTLLKLVINSGYRFVYPFLPAIGRGLGVDLAQMGALISVRWGVGFGVPFVVGTPYTSSQSRRLLVAGLVAFGAGSLTTAISGVFVGAVVGFVLMGIGKPVFDIGTQTYISERVAYGERARSLGILELSWAGGLLIGAPVAGWLIETGGWKVPFWAFGTVAIVSIASIYLLLSGSSRDDFEPIPTPDQPRSAVVPFLFVVVLTGFTMELPLVVLGAWLENDFAMALVALAGVGFLLGSAELAGEGLMVAFTDRIGKRNAFAFGLGGASLSAVLLGFSGGNLGLALASVFLVTFFLEFAFVSGIPLASEYRPSNRSRFLAWFMVASGVGRVIADLVGPALFEASGIRPVAWTAGVTALVGAMVLILRVREVHAEHASRPPLGF